MSKYLYLFNSMKTLKLVVLTAYFGKIVIICKIDCTSSYNNN